MSCKAYLGLGTNMGDREKNLRDALASLNLLPGTKVTALSKVYETDPVGYTDQQDFLNIAAEVETTLNPENLLGACLGIEAGLGRVRTVKNGPRIIDIDLLLYENEVYNNSTLILPHPRMKEREFVLRPLLDIDFSNPLFDRKEAEKSLTGNGVRLYCEKLL